MQAIPVCVQRRPVKTVCTCKHYAAFCRVQFKGYTHSGTCVPPSSRCTFVPVPHTCSLYTEIFKNGAMFASSSRFSSSVTLSKLTSRPLRMFMEVAWITEWNKSNKNVREGARAGFVFLPGKVIRIFLVESALKITPLFFFLFFVMCVLMCSSATEPGVCLGEAWRQSHKMVI